MSFQPKLEHSNPKLLIVERKLVSNRGHHHTQVAALKSLLPGHTAHLVAGEDYDGFLGPVVGRISQRGMVLSRLGNKIRYGSVLQRLTARLSLLKNGQIAAPFSAYGKTLAEVCRAQNFGAQDLIVIPTADLDSLESSIEASRLLGENAPRICLRFLNAELGEKKSAQRDKRLLSARELPANILLFSETEELADHLNNRFALNVVGCFFMPCSMEVGEAPSLPSLSGRRARIGVFGPPRKEKGSTRLAAITSSLTEQLKTSPGTEFDFIVQGGPKDFENGGVYSALKSFTAPSCAVKVTPVADKLSPSEFRELFTSVDMILLPYERSVYSLQGSGVIQDAIAALKPMIHTEGMSMRNLLAHGNAVSAVTDQDFAAAITRVASDLPLFVSGAKAAALYYDDQLKNSPLIHSLGLS